jgi:hypothetical protein
MPSFSQRKGLTSVSQIIQIESMNEELRNALWNVLDVSLWSSWGFVRAVHGSRPERMDKFSRRLWDTLFKLPTDRRPPAPTRLDSIRSFFFETEWYFVYDFLEFVIHEMEGERPQLAEQLNRALARESSGYRMIDGLIVDITSVQEVEMLESALQDDRFKGVTQHLRRALELFADRDNPDYRNSIKESISAVESMAKIATGESKGTLADALRALFKQGDLHASLRDGFLKLYGYTSDEGGIRHAILEEPNITSADARYFLMSCTSFTNYLKEQLP